MQKDMLVSFGHTIRKLRLEKNISQEQFADVCGLHRTYISDVELGKRNVSLANINKMSNALGIKTSTIFMEIENNETI